MSKPYAISCHPWKIQDGRIKDSKGNTLADLRYAANSVAVGNGPAMCSAPLMLEALKAQDAFTNGEPNTFGHDCGWCASCCIKIDALRRAAIAAAIGETK